jgi:hypothetical protein
MKNWATPLYWQPNQSEREVAAQAVPQKGGAQLVFSSNQVSNNALTFIAITPCRLVDTRGGAFNGISPFSGPSLAPMTTATFPVQEASGNTAPAPCGTIPSIAQAYSFNLTLVPAGGGRVNYVSMWPSGHPQPVVSTLDDVQGLIVSNAAIVPAGTVNGGISVFNDGPATTDVIIDMNGFFAAPTDLMSNTAVGLNALGANTTGALNTAVGDFALGSNTSGQGNTATGLSALGSNTIGNDNAAVGYAALQFNTSGSNNTAVGFAALDLNTTGAQNAALGAVALQSNTTGFNNTAVGDAALQANTTGFNNTAVGDAALVNNNTGYDNTAVGVGALDGNTTGIYNMASGLGALQANTTGQFNTASGAQALDANTTGNQNAAAGAGALIMNTTGGDNTALGAQALSSNTTACCNTALGGLALQSLTSGLGNIAVGYQAAATLTGGSNNIEIGSTGLAADNATIRIGTQSTQTITHIAGIYGGAPATPNLLVCIDASGLLGTSGCSTTPSSRRFKEQITDMGDSSSKLLQLRPVTFLYKPVYDDGSHTLQYGLIAEEVARIYPEMVGYDKDGQPSSVKYQSLAPMLLNEVQKQNAQIESQAEQIGSLQAQRAEIQTQREQIHSLENRLAALEALLSSQPSAPTRPASSQ